MARNVAQLHPRLQEAVGLIRAEFPELGIGECFRTVAEQNTLYAKGRTAPGSIVTYARGYDYGSQHQWGIAVDFFFNRKGQEYSNTAWFNRVGAFAKSIGLGWGGDWTSPVDRPHLYLPDWGSTTGSLKKQYETPDKFIATWKSATWIQDETGWWYRNSDGSYPKTAWKKIDDVWCYFNTDGYAIENKWHLIEGHWYYFNSDCSMKKGWLEYENEWYYLNPKASADFPEGAMITGWKFIDNRWYFFRKENEDGHVVGSVVKGWAKNEEYTYYFMPEAKGDFPECAMAEGWVLIDEKWYFFNQSMTCQPVGSMFQNHWITSKGERYYLKDDGVMAENETLVIGGEEYTFGEGGILKR